MSKPAFVAFLLATAAHASPDARGSHDFPLIQRFPHYHIETFEERAWDRVSCLDARGPPRPPGSDAQKSDGA